MIRLHLEPVVLGSLIEACVEIGDRDFLAILNRQQDGTLEVPESEMPVVMGYLQAIEQHLADKYPHYDEEDPLYSEEDEDAYFDGLETYRHPLVYELANKLGDDFLDRWVPGE